MNKTVNINLSGIAFTIDENAFERLNKYLDAIKSYFKNTEGSDEIIADIESRLAEMLNDQLQNGKKIIAIEDVNNVIKIMGEPEEFAGDEQEEEKTSQSTSSKEYKSNKRKSRRRIYRNREEKVLGGVCSGIGSYFDVDPIWFRLLFIISFFTFGSGFLIYILLWLIIPEAKTSAEKLEMRGEDVNVTNIEKTIKEELNDLKSKISNMADDVSNSVKKNDGSSSILSKLVGFVVNIVRILAKFIFKILGFLFIVFTIVLLIGLGMVLLGLAGLVSINIPSITVFSSNMILQIIAMLGLLFFIGIPILSLLYLAIRGMLGIKKRSSVVRTGMRAAWLVGLVLLVISAVIFFKGRSDNAQITDKIHIVQPPSNTLILDARDARESYEGKSFNLVGDYYHMRNDAVTLIDEVQLNIVRANGPNFELMITKQSDGNTARDAENNADNISYKVNQTDSLLLFDDMIQFEGLSLWKNREAKLTLKVPEGGSIYLTQAIESVIYDIKNVSNTRDRNMGGHTWLMTAEGLRCTDCDEEDASGSTSNRSESNQTFDYSDFNEIDISGVYDIDIEQSDVFEMTISGDENYIDQLDIEQIEDQLIIHHDWDLMDIFENRNAVNVVIKMPILESLEINGSSKSRIEGFNQNRLDVSITGENEITMIDIILKEIDIDLAGASRLTIKGSAEKMSADISGASKLFAKNFECSVTDLDLAGFCKAEVFTTSTLNIDAAGACAIYYKGEPNVTSDLSGTCKVKPFGR